MFCSNCGASHEDWVRFCTECGAPIDAKVASSATPAAPVNEETPVAEEVAVIPAAESASVETTYATPVEESVLTQEEQQPDESVLLHPTPMGEKPVSLGKWLALLSLEVLCSLAHIVLLFVWAFSHKSEKSMQNYARAKLIVMGASVALALLLIVIIFALVLPNIDQDVSTQLRWFFFE